MINYSLHTGNSLDVLRTLDENSVDSVVTDPPYELGFMDKGWDKTGIANSVELWSEVLRVLKPGGYLLAFGGTRTFHRMTCAVEDAGFEIRDCINWLYGSGFPKSLNVARELDKVNQSQADMQYTWENGYRYKPVTDIAKKWDGWGTALKPSWEPIILARKPLQGRVVDNIKNYGTGVLNIDECRIESDAVQKQNGRWPANTILDEQVAAMLDEKSGTTTSRPRKESRGFHDGGVTGFQHGGAGSTIADSGGASRFFYVAKASKSEREAGLEHLDVQAGEQRNQGRDFSLLTSAGNERNVLRANIHPTVKPITLMRYLVNLITPTGGVTLDPFCGSGSTGCAAVMEGFTFVGIDLNPSYIEVADARIKYWSSRLDKKKL